MAGKAHLALIRVMGSERWTARRLSALTGTPEHAVTATLKGMQARGEVHVFKPRKQPAPFEYKLKDHVL